MLKEIKQLGQGGFGIVHLVELSGQQYARKTFDTNHSLDPTLIDNVKRRFIKEAKVQGTIVHHNIVPVIGGDLNIDPPYYLMPVANSTLQDEISISKNINGKFLSVISDIIAGLEELHKVQIYHRDLKPSNVLKFSDPSGDYYAISDFGLISQKDSRLSSLTSTGMAKGSDYYTAPEIVANLRHASAQSDIYSLGCILHDMIGKEDRVPCHEIREDGPFSAILLSCTRADPKRRFKSVGALLDALVAVNAESAPEPTPFAAQFIEKLNSPDALDRDFYRNLIDYLDRASRDDKRLLFMNLSSARIGEVGENFLFESSAIGGLFSTWVNSSAFDFESCDGLANRLEVFFHFCDFATKIECLMTMLNLGVSHNRWYVERKFMRLCDPSMDNALAQRLSIEFRVSDSDICYLIGRWERSIGVSRNSLHPLLVQTLASICK